MRRSSLCVLKLGFILEAMNIMRIFLAAKRKHDFEEEIKRLREAALRGAEEVQSAASTG